MNSSTVNLISSATSTGIHYYWDYTTCPRLFFLKHIAGYVRPGTPKPLALGILFHEAKSTYYNTDGDFNAVRTHLIPLFESLKEQDELHELPDNTVEIILKAITSWAKDFGIYDLRNSKIVLLEQTFTAELPHSHFIFSGRIDTVVQVGKELILLETKSTSWNEDLMVNLTSTSDQVRMYLYLLRQNGYPASRVIIDVTNLKTRHSQRSSVLSFSDLDVRYTAEAIDIIFEEIWRRLTTTKQGTPPSVAFPRFTHSCFRYGRYCDYYSLCHHGDFTHLIRIPNFSPTLPYRESLLEEASR